jgi:hypothetical protein
MSKCVRSLALAGLGILLLAPSGFGQTAVVLQNANLRRDPRRPRRRSARCNRKSSCRC